MQTLTRKDLITTLAGVMPLASNAEVTKTAETVIGVIKSSIFNRDRILLKNGSRIVVTLKAARVGRNPKTMEEAPISARHSIVVNATARTPHNAAGDNVFGKMAFVDVLVGLGYNRRLATDITTTFYSFINRVVTEQLRIEIRGLGVFKPKIQKAGRKLRNPKTAEEFVTTEDKVSLAFKCAPTLRKAIDKEYL